jgi:hypothetical protein
VNLFAYVSASAMAGRYRSRVRTRTQTFLGVIWAMELEGVFRLAESAYFQARETGSRVDWVICISFSELYVRMGGDKNVHVFLNFALNSVGRVAEALESCKKGLALEPANEHLLTNRRLYEYHLRASAAQAAESAN